VTSPCPFCQNQPRSPSLLVYAREVPEQYLPATNGHTLVIPRRHVVDWWHMTYAEQHETCRELERQRNLLMALDPTITGFNIGMNTGEDAGQTVFHAHTHLIPRRKGDVDDPRWGIARSIILERKRT